MATVDCWIEDGTHCGSCLGCYLDFIRNDYIVGKRYQEPSPTRSRNSESTKRSRDKEKSR